MKPYQIQYGIPEPTNRFCRDGIRIKQQNVVQLHRSAFPHQILPSGGASCILSESEMFAVVVSWGAFDDIDTTTHIYFYKDEKQLFHLEGVDFAEDSEGRQYGAFVGNYDWELANPGQYYAKIVTQYGEDIINFEVF